MATEIEQYLMAKFQKGLNEEEKKKSPKIPLFRKFQDIKTLLEKILSQSPSSISSIREKLYYLNDLLSESQILSTNKHGFRSPQQLLDINKIRIKLNKIKAELDSAGPSNAKVNPKPQPNGAAAIPAPGSNNNEISTPSGSIDASRVHGFDEHLASLERLLLRRGSDDNRNKAIAIVGVEGVGKTTLCRLVFNKEEVKNRFLPRVWVSMSRLLDEDNDPKLAVAKRILAGLGVEKEMIKLVFEKGGLTGLLCAIHLELVGKRYLIVLDDARETTDQWFGNLNGNSTTNSCLGRQMKLECLAHGLPNGHGGTVLITSGNEYVAKHMVGEVGVTTSCSIIPLLPLADVESCWKIFKESVEKDGRLRFCPLNERDLKEEIKERCGGIPLGAKIMGDAVYNDAKKY